MSSSPEPPVEMDTAVEFADVPGTGAIPTELLDPANYLVFDRLGRKPSSSKTTVVDGHLEISDDQTVLGLVVREVLESTPAELGSTAAEVADTGDGHAPAWLTTSATPRLGPQREPHALVRRNGSKVRPEWVFAPDGRNQYYPNTYPLCAVGRLFVWNNAANPGWAWSGSASMVSSRTILTASHCVPWGSSNWKALFIPAFWDGASVFGAAAASWVTSAQGYRNHSQGDDMAVMRLAVPLGNSVGWFGYRTYTDDWEDRSMWNLPGYPGDRDNGNRPVVHTGFPITDDDNDGAGVELEYRADSASGQSGAPVYGWFGNTPAVVGTHSGGEDNFGEPRQNVAAGGAALSNLINWARQNWG